MSCAAYVGCCGMGCLVVTTEEVEEETVSSSSHLTLRKAISQGCELKTLRQFWKLGLPGGAMMAADASSFDVTTAFAGALGAHEHPPPPPPLLYALQSSS